MDKLELDILIDYLSGQISASDKIKVEEWINSSEENKNLFQSVKSIWDVPAQNFPQPDTEAALQKVWAQINSGNKSKIYKLETKPTVNYIFQTITQSSFIRVAASILIIISAVYFVSTLFYKSETALVQIKSEVLQTIKLSDGTIVTLDKGSSFSYQENFENSGKREVSLNGEAFFEVVKNVDVPFIINANNGKIKVLGTKFNVRAWENSGDVTVAVSEGKVALSDSTQENSVVITKGKMSRLSNEGIVSEPVDVDLSQYLSWINKQIYFKNTTVDEVLAQLERWYDVKIKLQDAEINNSKITVFIDDKPLEENLNVVCAILNMRFTTDGTSVRLLPNN